MIKILSISIILILAVAITLDLNELLSVNKHSFSVNNKNIGPANNVESNFGVLILSLVDRSIVTHVYLSSVIIESILKFKTMFIDNSTAIANRMYSTIDYVLYNLMSKRIIAYIEFHVTFNNNGHMITTEIRAILAILDFASNLFIDVTLLMPELNIITDVILNIFKTNIKFYVAKGDRILEDWLNNINDAIHSLGTSTAYLVIIMLSSRFIASNHLLIESVDACDPFELLRLNALTDAIYL
jgi:hypothetical protein